MTKIKFSNSLKTIIAVMAGCGIFVYFFIIPSFGRIIADYLPEYAYCYWPWLIFLWCTAIPLAVSCISLWKIVGRMHDGNAFSFENAKSFNVISLALFVDAIFYLAGNVIFFFLSMNHPGMIIISLVIWVIALAMALFASALSKLVYSGAVLRTENELTI